MSNNSNQDKAQNRVDEFKKTGVKKFLNGIKSFFKSSKKETVDENSLQLEAIVREYLPKLWSDYNSVKWNNNCYSYACNDPFNHVGGTPQPGQKSSITIKKLNVENVAEAALADGLVKADLDENGKPIKREGFYLVAVAIAEGRDYHWYRQDEDGSWTHKPGTTEICNRDNRGNKITDPEFCERGIYKQFGGYFYVPNGGIRVGIKARDEKANTLNDDYTKHIERIYDQNEQKKFKNTVKKYGIFKEVKKPQTLEDCAALYKEAIKKLANNAKNR